MVKVLPCHAQPPVFHPVPSDVHRSFRLLRFPRPADNTSELIPACIEQLYDVPDDNVTHSSLAGVWRKRPYAEELLHPAYQESSTQFTRTRYRAVGLFSAIRFDHAAGKAVYESDQKISRNRSRDTHLGLNDICWTRIRLILTINLFCFTHIPQCRYNNITLPGRANTTQEKLLWLSHPLPTMSSADSVWLWGFCTSAYSASDLKGAPTCFLQ